MEIKEFIFCVTKPKKKQGKREQRGSVGRNGARRMVGRSSIPKVLLAGDSSAGDRQAGPWLRTSKTLHGSMKKL